MNRPLEHADFIVRRAAREPPLQMATNLGNTPVNPGSDEMTEFPSRAAASLSGAKDALVRSSGSEFFLRLADAGTITVKSYDPGYKAGVKLTLSNWSHGDRSDRQPKLDLALFLTICLEGEDEELVFETQPFPSLDSWPDRPITRLWFSVSVAKKRRGPTR